MKQKISAALIAFCLFALCLFLIGWLSDSPRSIVTPANRASTAAIAIRDNVIPFQKFGTRLFTLPYLEKCYNEVSYFTQSGRLDKKEEFIAALDSLLGKYKSVDIFLLAHANSYHRWLNDLPEAKREHIRLVYNTGCGSSSQCADWLTLGAKAYVGHPGEQSISPVFYFFFLRRWSAGEKLQDVIRESNELMLSKMNRIGNLSFGLLCPETQDIIDSQAICFGDSTLSIDN